MNYIRYYYNHDAKEFFADVDRLDSDVFELYEKFLPDTEKTITPILRVFEAGMQKLSSLASASNPKERKKALELLGKRFATPQIGKHALEIIIQATREILKSHPKETDALVTTATNLFRGVSMPAADQWYLNWDRDSKNMIFTFLTELVTRNKKAVWPSITEQLVEVLKANPYGSPFTEIDSGLLIPIEYQPQNDELSAYFYVAKREFVKVLECREYASPAIRQYIVFFITNGWEIVPAVISALVDSGDVGVEYFLWLWQNRVVCRVHLKLDPVISGSTFLRFLQEKSDTILSGFMKFADHFSEQNAGVILDALLKTFPEYGQRFFAASDLDRAFKTHVLWYANWLPADETEKRQFETETQLWQQKIQAEQLQGAHEHIRVNDYLSAAKVGAWGVMALYRELVNLISLKRSNISWSHLSFNETSFKQLEKARELIDSCNRAIREYKWQLSLDQKTSLREIQSEIESMLSEKKSRIEGMPLFSASEPDDNNSGPFEDHPGVDIAYFDRKNKETELKYQKEFYESVKNLFC